MSAADLIADIRSLLTGEPVFLAGSLVAEQTYGMSNAHSDVDLFCPTQNVLIAVGQKLLCNGYTLDSRMDRVWARWLRYGMKGWHTNSLRLMSPAGVETNLVYKTADGHPTTSLAQVIESFDFGLLASGWDLELDVFRDMRSYLFPGYNPDGALPMMPLKAHNWKRGLISNYNGIRELGRYAKYHRYGHDMSLVKDELITGYMEASIYHAGSHKPDGNLRSQIYSAAAAHIENDNIAELELAAKQIDYDDSLDVIMAALE